MRTGNSSYAISEFEQSYLAISLVFACPETSDEFSFKSFLYFSTGASGLSSDEIPEAIFVKFQQELLSKLIKLTSLFTTHAYR